MQFPSIDAALRIVHSPTIYDIRGRPRVDFVTNEAISYVSPLCPSQLTVVGRLGKWRHLYIIAFLPGCHIDPRCRLEYNIH